MPNWWSHSRLFAVICILGNLVRLRSYAKKHRNRLEVSNNGLYHLTNFEVYLAKVMQVGRTELGRSRWKTSCKCWLVWNCICCESISILGGGGKGGIY